MQLNELSIGVIVFMKMYIWNFGVCIECIQKIIKKTWLLKLGSSSNLRHLAEINVTYIKKIVSNDDNRISSLRPTFTRWDSFNTWRSCHWQWRIYTCWVEAIVNIFSNTYLICVRNYTLMSTRKVFPLQYERRLN